MSLKALVFMCFAKWKVRQEYKIHREAAKYQRKFLKRILVNNKNTLFGVEQAFGQFNDIRQYQENLRIRSYEDFIPYINKIKQGENNILLKDEVRYLLMTSGTTAGSKYIPISLAGIRKQIDAATKVLCFFAVNTGRTDFMNHKMIFLQGSPELENTHSIPSGRLSGVVYHHVPTFFQRNKLPSYEVNIISDWQKKLDNIMEETAKQDISIIGGIPPWCLQYFEKLLLATKRTNLKELFPNLAAYIHGGLDFTNYKQSITKALGEQIPCLQTFPASEGFFAIQDRLDAEDMLLLLDQGVFYEFLPFGVELSVPVGIEYVCTDVRYELIITNNSGLYRYAMGDLIVFTSLSPYRIRVVGRTSQFLSSFGEHVIADEIEKSMAQSSALVGLDIADYYVYASVSENRYIWQLEVIGNVDENKLQTMATTLDDNLSKQNKYYAHLLSGEIIKPCRIEVLAAGSLNNQREKKGKLGGQNKIIRMGTEPINRES